MQSCFDVQFSLDHSSSTSHHLPESNHINIQKDIHTMEPFKQTIANSGSRLYVEHWNDSTGWDCPILCFKDLFHYTGNTATTERHGHGRSECYLNSTFLSREQLDHKRRGQLFDWMSRYKSASYRPRGTVLQIKMSGDGEVTLLSQCRRDDWETYRCLELDIESFASGSLNGEDIVCLGVMSVCGKTVLNY